MRNPLSTLFLVLALTSSAVAQTPSPISPAKIARLIEQLGSPEFTQRELAMQQLATIGEPALTALKKAAMMMDDMEVTQRATELVVTIEKQIETDRILAPTLVELNCDTAPLADAFQQLERQSGYKVQCLDLKIKARNVTVKTPGKVPFWTAVENLCAAANLDTAEGNFDAAMALRVRGLEQQIQQTPKAETTALDELRAELDRVKQCVRPSRSSYARAITFYSRLDQTCPRTVSKSVCVEAMPYPAPAVRDQLLTLLQVTAEPKVQLMKVESVRVTKAIDDQSQALNTIPVLAPFVMAPPDPNARFVPGRPRVIVIDTDVAPSPAPLPFTLLPTQSVVRFASGDKHTKQIKELQGVIRATVRTASEIYATVTDLDKLPTGRATGTHGVKMLVSRPNKALVGNQDALLIIAEYTLGDVHFGEGYTVFDPNDILLLQNGGLARGARGRVRPDEIFNTKYSCQNGLKVVDKNNQPFEVEIALAARSFTQGGRVIETLKLTISPTDKTQGGPVTVTVGGTRSRIVEIPFQLSNVPVASAPND